MTKKSDRSSGKKRTVWFSNEQQEVMAEILELTGRETTVSSAIREGLNLLLKSIKESK